MIITQIITLDIKTIDFNEIMKIDLKSETQRLEKSLKTMYSCLSAVFVSNIQEYVKKLAFQEIEESISQLEILQTEIPALQAQVNHLSYLSKDKDGDESIGNCLKLQSFPSMMIYFYFHHHHHANDIHRMVIAVTIVMIISIRTKSVHP
jgi:ABC-type phosphate transport system auxiliary subunit